MYARRIQERQEQATGQTSSIYGIILVQLITDDSIQLCHLWNDLPRTSVSSSTLVPTVRKCLTGSTRFLFQIGAFKVRVRHVWVAVFMLFYTYRVRYSRHNGTIPERMSIFFYALLGVVYILPVHYTVVFYSPSTQLSSPIGFPEPLPECYIHYLVHQVPAVVPFADHHVHRVHPQLLCGEVVGHHLV